MLEALDQAAGVLADLDEAGVTVRLVVDEGGVRAEAVGPDGQTSAVPMRRLLDALAGDGRGLAVDTHG